MRFKEESMLSLTRFYVRFTLCWRMALFALLMMGLFTRLGFWQLQRADEKKQMLSTHQRFAKQPPIVWSSNKRSPIQYQPMKVSGQFLSRILLLDNQHYQHRFGYHVISPLQLENGRVILVDRGWSVGDITRQKLPMVDTPNGTLLVRGSAYYPPINPWNVGPLIEKEQGDLVVIERMDTKLISQFLHKSIYPFIIRLGALESAGYVRDWAIVAMPPERHYAYALQWFAMALVVFIIFIALTFKKKT